MFEKLSVDKAISKVGQSNRYQIILFLVLFTQVLFTAIVTQGNAYLYHDPEFICQDGTEGEECKQNKACHEVGNDWRKIVVKEGSNKTFTFLFNLYCDRKTLKSITQSLTFIGCSLGTFFFSYFMDKFGRKNTIKVTLFVVTSACAIWAFPQNVYWLMAANFIQGFGLYAQNTVAFLMMNEQSGGKFREVTVGLLILGITVSNLYTCLIAYIFDNNALIMVRYFIFPFYIILNIPNFFMVESPRYYLKKDNEKTIEMFNKIAKYNKKPSISYEEFDFSEHENNGMQKDHNYISLFTFKSLRSVTIIASIVKFNMTFVKYGESFALDDLDMNLYIGGAFSGGLNLVSFLFSGFLLSKCKRRNAMFWLGLGTSVLDIAQIFFKVPETCEGFHCWQRWASLFSYGFSSSFSQMYFTVLSQYFPELYPTKVRGMGLGFIRGIGIAGSALCPYIIQAFESIDVNPLVPMGLVGLLSLTGLYFLFETKDKPLEDFIKEEIECKDHYTYDKDSIHYEAVLSDGDYNASKRSSNAKQNKYVKVQNTSTTEDSCYESHGFSKGRSESSELFALHNGNSNKK